MRLRRAALLTMATVLVAGACSKKQPPAPPAPPPPAPREQPAPVRTADPDSARRAEEARLARERAELMTTLQEMIFFDYDDSRIRQDGQAALSRKVPILRANPGVTLRIVGHADERGSLEYNLALGMRRARAVRDYLANFGIDASRLTTDSMGEERPLDPGHTEAAWSRNRRAEVTVTGGAGNLVRGQ